MGKNSEFGWSFSSYKCDWKSSRYHFQICGSWIYKGLIYGIRAETGITINTVVPGLIDTVRGASAGSSLVHPSHSNPPVGRKGFPIEVATMIANLCGPNSDFVTGQTIHVNGGSYYP